MGSSVTAGMVTVRERRMSARLIIFLSVAHKHIFSLLMTGSVIILAKQIFFCCIERTAAVDFPR